MIPLDPLYFFVALCFGFFMTYIFTPSPTIIYQYPTPDTVKDTTYIDAGKHCFKYASREVSCPNDRKKIFQIPQQKMVENKD